jgi:hypothetical protein
MLPTSIRAAFQRVDLVSCYEILLMRRGGRTMSWTVVPKELP